MYPSIKTLSTFLEPEIARTVRKLMIGELSPFSVPATDDWRRACFHAPREDAPETIMHAIDATIGTHGTEAIFAGELEPAAEYCNAGDSYSTTILYDYTRDRFYVTTWGDWFERNERSLG